MGIRVDPAASVPVNVTANLSLSFGIDNSQPSAPAFFVPANGISASVAVNANSIQAGVDVGFLGTQANGGTMQLNAQGSLNNAGNLTVNTGTAQGTSLESGTLTMSTSGSNSVSVALPLAANLECKVRPAR